MEHVWAHPANRNARLAAIGRLLRWQVQKHLLRQPLIVNLGAGRRFKIPIDSKFSSLVYYNRLPDWDEMNFLLRVLRPGDRFVDIGANVGFYSILASQKVTAPNIFAFEANPANVTVLREQATINRLDGLQIFPYALGSRRGRLSFRAGDRETGAVSPAGAAGAFIVECRTLDELLVLAFTNCEAIAKMDVEGYEVEVLLGAPRLLKDKVIGTWLFELSAVNLSNQNRSIHELLNLFSQSGYRFYFWNESAEALDEVEPEVGRVQNYIACCRGREWIEQRLRRA